MHPLRGFTSRSRRLAIASSPDPDGDLQVVRSFTSEVKSACIDLIDLPFDHSAQQHLISLLLNRAEEAANAMNRLQDNAEILPAPTAGPYR